MGGLYKKEVIIRPTSNVTIQGAIDFTKGWLNDTFQNKADNKDANGDYIDYFFGDIFDARSGNIYRVFSNACADKYNMTDLVFDVLITSKFATTKAVKETVTAVENTLVKYKDRIVALEKQDDTVEAVVI